MMFGYSDRELVTKSGYDLVHPDDLSYFAAAHQECKYLTINSQKNRLNFDLAMIAYTHI